MSELTLHRSGKMLSVCHDREFEQFKRIPEGVPIRFKYTLGRCYKRHCRMFQFFNFCFEHWGENKYPMHFADMSEKEQFDWFRKTMTIQAGYYNVSLPASLNESDLNIRKTNMVKNEKYGYYELIPSIEFQTMFKVEAQSLSYESMSEDKFSCLYNRLINVAMRQIFDYLTPDTAEHQATMNELIAFFP